MVTEQRGLSLGHGQAIPASGHTSTHKVTARTCKCMQHGAYVRRCSAGSMDSSMEHAVQVPMRMPLASTASPHLDVLNRKLHDGPAVAAKGRAGVVVELAQRHERVLVVLKLHKAQALAAPLAVGVVPALLAQDLGLRYSTTASQLLVSQSVHGASGLPERGQRGLRETAGLNPYTMHHGTLAASPLQWCCKARPCGLHP